MEEGVNLSYTDNRHFTQIYFLLPKSSIRFFNFPIYLHIIGTIYIV